MAKRLSEKQKKEIIKSFTDGKTIDFLSNKFECTKLTIIRNLKKNLGEQIYKKLIEKGKNLNQELFLDKNKINHTFNSELNKGSPDGDVVDINSTNEFENVDNISFEASFLELAPLDYEIDEAPRKELSSIHISDIDFPKVVYMIVDKKIELEIKLLKDFPDWAFLPIEDLNRKTIEIYLDLKIAKRFCSNDKKVIKVPNTDVFKLVAPVLISRGISRIVSADKLIAL
ncbi:hypothetical protein OA189_01680 [Prochlorococcus sp. AH-716-P20]|nr:hypothetical protein [Prochlorococcus sp. AH-716-P20]